MFARFFSTEHNKPKNDLEDSQRRFERRARDRCVCKIANQLHPVVNWSVGGALVQIDNRTLTVGDEFDTTLKFFINQEQKEVQTTARVVRKFSHYAALEFKNTKTQDNLKELIEEMSGKKANTA